MRILLFSILWVSLLGQASVEAKPAAMPMTFKAPDIRQTTVLKKVLGSDFTVRGVMYPPEVVSKVLVAEVVVNEQKLKGMMFAVQLGSCSNHACTIEVLINRDGNWEHLTSLDSYTRPYISETETNQMRDLVVFDHVSNDCEACSPPSPVKMVWDPSAEVPDSEEKGAYVSRGVVTGNDLNFFKRKPW
jgi:hypothetical protein